jgi:peptidoglycan/LPS O-acetylase OafA/YrhL
MIPTMLVVGLVLGGLLHRRPAVGVVAVVAAAGVWAAALAVADDQSFSEAAGGFALAGVNLLVGALVAAAVVRAVRARGRPTARS